MTERKFEIWYRLLYVFAVLSACSLLPLIDLYKVPSGFRDLLMRVCGICFWGFLLLECVFLWLCRKLRQSLIGKYESTKIIWNGAIKPGITAISRDTIGRYADITALGITIITIILYIADVQSEWIVIPLIVLTFLSLNARCLLNGKNRNLHIKINTSKTKGKKETKK